MIYSLSLDDANVWLRLEKEGDKERLTVDSVNDDVRSMISFTLTKEEKERLMEFLI